MNLKYRVVECNSNHCRVYIYSKNHNGDTWAKIGELVFSPTEWLLFSTAQLMASEQMTTGGHAHYKPIFEDDLYQEYIKREVV